MTDEMRTTLRWDESDGEEELVVTTTAIGDPADQCHADHRLLDACLQGGGMELEEVKALVRQEAAAPAPTGEVIIRQPAPQKRQWAKQQAVPQKVTAGG